MKSGGCARRLRGMLFAACLLSAPASYRALAANLPPGFEEVVVASGGTLSSLRSIAFAPDGDLFIAAGYGWVWVLSDGVLTKVAEIPVHFYGEAGLCDVTIDPDYATNRGVWISYSPSETSLRVSRFTYSGGQLVNEAIITEWPVSGPFHLSASLRFASDKTLFISTGDNEQRSTTSQNAHDLRGKVLHINRDGSGAAGNPYFDGVFGDPRVWALGFRNPFRCSVQPHTDTLFIADVGDGMWEEISLGVAGGNFGWAEIEGPTPAGRPGYVYPFYSYDHSDPRGAAVIGGAHAHHDDFSPEYDGDYFFGDSSRNALYRMRLDASNQPISTEIWATDTPAPVSIQFGPDGALYYASYAPASVRKIRYVGGTNRQPVAAAAALPDNGLAPLTTTLDGTASNDPDDDPLNHIWDLGDGSNASGAIVSHAYPTGVYLARLIVEDSHGASDHSPDLRIVSGNQAPTATISAPADQSPHAAGETIAYSGLGVDPESGNVPCERFSWTVLFHHLGHVHPHVGPIEGTCSGSFTTADTGETSIQTHYELQLNVLDDGAPLGSNAVLTGSRSIEIRPRTASVTLATEPLPNLQLTLDTQSFTAPMTVEGVLNFRRTIGTVEAQVAEDGHAYRWLQWSDGGAQVHEIRLGDTSKSRSLVPPTSSTITATFGCDVIAEVTSLRVDHAAGGGPGLTLRWDPVFDPCLATSGSFYRIYAAAGARPATGSGGFPLDPAFTPVGETTGLTFTYLPGSLDAVFVVVAIGTDGQPGRLGHYGH